MADKKKKKKRARRRAIRSGILIALSLVLVVVILSGAAVKWFASDDVFDALPSNVVDSGNIRVQLRSLGSREALGLTLDGVYTVDGDKGFRFARGTALSVAVDGGDLLLTAGGLTVDMGSSFTLTRHAVSKNESNGLYIHESEKDTLFVGDLKLTNDNGNIDAVLTIQVEDYLNGVVAYEMSNSFPLEALKAQAVAARTYAMRAKKNAGNRAYDLVDTTADQVFKGFDPSLTRVIQAVEETRGVVGMVNETYAGCYYTASNGGQVASSDQVWGGKGVGYIEMKDDPYDLQNPSSVEKRGTFSKTPLQDDVVAQMICMEISEEMAARGYSDDVEDIRVEEIVSVTPADSDKEGSLMYGSMVFEVRVSGRRFMDGEPIWAEPTEEPTAEPTVELTVEPTAELTVEPTVWTAVETTAEPTAEPVPVLGDFENVEGTLSAKLKTYGVLEKALNISINTANYEVFAVEESTDSFTIVSRRYGHGVGMSQRGAQTMAGAYGMSAEDILKFYYPGMALYRIDWQESTLTALEDLPASVGYARVRPTPRPTQAPLPALQGDEYYARVVLGTSSSALNVREGPSTSTSVLGTLLNNNRLIVVEAAPNNWFKIKTTEISGYVSGDYIRKE